MKLHILSFTRDGETSIYTYRSKKDAWIGILGILEFDRMLDASEADECRALIKSGDIDAADWQMQEACSASSDYSWHIQEVSVPTPKRRRPRIIIEVSGGVVQTVYADTDCNVSVLDNDDMGDADAKHLSALRKETKKLKMIL